MNLIKLFSLVNWLWICFVNYKILSFQSVRHIWWFEITINIYAKFFIYLFEAFILTEYAVSKCFSMLKAVTGKKTVPEPPF